MVMLVAAALLALPMTASAASFGKVGARGESAPVVRTATPDYVPSALPLYTITASRLDHLAMPVSRAMVYLALLGWSGTWDEWLALGWYGQCVWYVGQVPGYAEMTVAEVVTLGGAIVVVASVTEVIKRAAAMTDVQVARFGPLIAVFLGVVVTVAASAQGTDAVAGGLTGLIAGASASGIYSYAKPMVTRAGG